MLSVMLSAMLRVIYAVSFMYNVTNKPFLVSVIMLNVSLLNVLKLIVVMLNVAET